MLLFAILMLSRIPQQWTPEFDSQHLTNQTLQRAFASHPPLRRWVHQVINARSPDWRSIDDLLIDYMSSTTRALFVQDVVAIDTEHQLRQDLESKRKEVLRLNLKHDPSGRDWDTDRILALKKNIALLKSNRVAMDPSGGVNHSRAATAAVAAVAAAS